MTSDGTGRREPASTVPADTGPASSHTRSTLRHGNTRLILQLDSGGMAEVHLALARGLAGVERLVVTKRLRPEFRDEPEYIAMFLEEARLAARLSHPNIVHTYEVGQDQGTWFIAMEFLQGQTLARLRKRARAHGGVPLVLHLKILSDALTALDYAHELTDFAGTPLELVHRDVNPQNIFVGYDGQVTLLDFGIAKAVSSDLQTRPGWLKGKLRYMAPEQVCEDTVDRRVDIFSVGAMLWEAVTGRPLWEGVEEITIFRRILQGDVPWLTPVTGVPPALAAIYERALAYRPDGRFSSATNMQLAIDAYLGPTDDQWSKRDLGRYVSDLFAEERERLRRMIAEELARDAPERASGVPVYSPGPNSDRARITVAKARPAPEAHGHEWTSSNEITRFGNWPPSEQPKPNPALAITTPSSGEGARSRVTGPVARAMLAAVVGAGILAASAALARWRGATWGHARGASAPAANALTVSLPPVSGPSVNVLRAKALPASGPVLPSSNGAAIEDRVVEAPARAPAVGATATPRIPAEKRGTPRANADPPEDGEMRQKKMGRRALDAADPWNR